MVLSLMAEGQTNRSIAQALHLSARTVEAHVTAIFTKLGLDPSAGGERRVLAVVAYLQAGRR
jgi:DNA-binding NarL/FixJ family response regulator